MITIYHNPRCSKSRQALALLKEYGEAVTVINYLQNPPSVQTLLHLARLLNMKPLAFIRTTEKTFSELGLSPTDERSDTQWCQIMADSPLLIERPIIVRGKRACIGRVLENIRILIDS